MKQNGFVRNDQVLRATRATGRILLSPFFRLETEGAENLPKDCAFVLLPKHQRWEDIPLLSLASPRPLYYVAKYELFRNGLSAWFIRSLGGIPLNRKKPLESRRALKAVIGHLRQGEGMVVFPEGTYYRGTVGPGQQGVVRLILSRIQLPFVPVGIQYSPGARTPVRIRFGEKFYGKDYGSAAAFVEGMMGEIARLSGLKAGGGRNVPRSET